MVSHLTGITSDILFEQGPLAGALFENYIISEILKKETHNKTHAELFYYRTSHGEEIDLIIDRKQTKEFIKIKNSETFKPRMAKVIESFAADNDQGYLLYRGKELAYAGDIKAIDYKSYLMKH